MPRPTPATPAARLRPCPATPNCVATGGRGGRPGQAMEPIPYRDPRAARARLRAILAELPRTRIVTDDLDLDPRQGGGYLHAEVRSPLLRFVDDVEFAFDDAAGRLHFRSASRLGRSDFGVNRRRMEALRRAFLGAETD